MLMRFGTVSILMERIAIPDKCGCSGVNKHQRVLLYNRMAHKK